MDLSQLSPTKLSVVAPWWMLSDVVHKTALDSKLTKSYPHASTLFSALISDNFPEREEIYADGSLIKGNVTLVGAGMSIPHQTLKFHWKIPNHH